MAHKLQSTGPNGPIFDQEVRFAVAGSGTLSLPEET